MGLGDYFKGPEHKANAARLQAELQAYSQQCQADILLAQAKYNDLEVELLAHRQQFQADNQALQARYDELETQAKEIGLLDLLAVQKQIRAEEVRLASVHAQVATTQSDLEAARGPQPAAFRTKPWLHSPRNSRRRS